MKSSSHRKQVRFKDDLYDNSDLRAMTLSNKRLTKTYSPVPDTGRNWAQDRRPARRSYSCNDVIVSGRRTRENIPSMSSSMPNILSIHQYKPTSTHSLSSQGRPDEYALDDDGCLDVLAVNSGEIVRNEPSPPYPRPYGVAGVTVYPPHEHYGESRSRSPSFEHQERNENRIVSSTTKDKPKKNKQLSEAIKLIQQATDSSNKKKGSKEFDENGRCRRHPHIVLAQKRPFAKGWNKILGYCPLCEAENHPTARSATRDRTPDTSNRKVRSRSTSRSRPDKEVS